ncbi:MAG: hypothetical protein GY807_19540 [Gammaproteobacteria bacterium]|nr:hypothetical protein [Gammaproteobacteria bacterium]
MQNFWNQLTSVIGPSAFSTGLIMVSALFMLLALGIKRDLHVLGQTITVPNVIRARIVFASISFVLLGVGIALAYLFSDFKEAYRALPIYLGGDAKQIATDGEDIYVLRMVGNIERVADPNDRELVDSGTNTQDIISSGGRLWILKNSGQLHVYSRLKESYAPQKPRFKLIDDTLQKTQKIVPVGDSVYVLKTQGSLWKIQPRHIEKTFNTSTPAFILIMEADPDDRSSQVADISSSGTALFVLTNDGNIHAYEPNTDQPLTRIYDGADALSIEADGSTVYFRRNDKSVWKIGKRQVEIIMKQQTAEDLISDAGTLYIRTQDGRVYRYQTSASEPLRLIEEAGAEVRRILVNGGHLFAINKAGNVVRFSPYILKRSN